MLVRLSLAMVLVLSFFSVSRSQDTAATCTTSSLYGIVLSSVPERPVPTTWLVQVTAKGIGDGNVLDRRESQREMYCVKVPVFSKAFVFFERSGFEPQRTEPVFADERKKHSFALPVIKLDPIAARQQQNSSGAQRDDIRAKLKMHKEALSATDSTDIFTWNVELYKHIFKNNPEVTAEIESFMSELKNDPDFVFFSTTEYEEKSKVFSFLVARMLAQPVEQNVKTADITALINDSRLFAGIRSEAMTVLSTLGLKPNETAQLKSALMKAAEHDNSVVVRTNAIQALSKYSDRAILSRLQKLAENDGLEEVRVAATAAARTIEKHIDQPRTANILPSEPRNVPEATYSIIEYPAKKEVTIDLRPINSPGAKGVATILRDDDGTRIYVRLSDLPRDLSALVLYAVDDRGRVNALGTVAIENGAGTLDVTTPLSKFMLVASPEAALTSYDANTRVYFRSTVPKDFVAKSPESSVGERVGAVVSAGVPETPSAATGTPYYWAPILNVQAYRATKVKTEFAGALSHVCAEASITPRRNKPTKVNIRLDGLNELPAGEKLILWAVASGYGFVKLGQIVKEPGRNQAQIEAETMLSSFDLLITLESDEGHTPTGPVVGRFYGIPS